ncbi:MAG: P1 family peptidase [Thermomicrobiales bacterium]|nr:P1 family peptidase [Thermomicrobiales bacterium]
MTDVLASGVHNAITDVPGIRVGQVTVREEGRFNTGITAIVPDTLPIPAAVFAGNGYGKLIGVTQIQELGEIETPILLTGTLSAFRVADHLVSWMLQQQGNEEMTSVNPVVGETNDGYLSDIRARPLAEEHVFAALQSATDGPVVQGCVGAGAGTSMCGFKGGIGTSSRIVSLQDGDAFTIGALAQTNFGGTLTIAGKPYPVPIDSSPEFGSCMIVVATDASLDARQLARVARRAVFAMARVGASYSHGSGDYAIAISTRRDGSLPDAALSPIFTATMDAVESALLNSALHAETTHGPDGRVRRSLPDCYPDI